MNTSTHFLCGIINPAPAADDGVQTRDVYREGGSQATSHLLVQPSKVAYIELLLKLTTSSNLCNIYTNIHNIQTVPSTQ